MYPSEDFGIVVTLVLVVLVIVLFTINLLILICYCCARGVNPPLVTCCRNRKKYNFSGQVTINEEIELEERKKIALMY